MNSLSTQYRRSQLIARPVPGGAGPVQFVYGVRVPGGFEPVCYQFAQWVVGDFNGQAEKVARAQPMVQRSLRCPGQGHTLGAPDTARYIPA